MISAIILAAGESKRMTLGNKLLLRKNNVPLIKITFENIKASKVDNISIVLMAFNHIFSCESSSRNANVRPSVSPSVCQHFF